jgi:hypothetical protein
MELHVSLATAVPNGRWLEYIPQLDDITATGMTIRDGQAVPSSDPGLGIDWNLDAIEHMTVEGSRTLLFGPRRLAGSRAQLRQWTTGSPREFNASSCSPAIRRMSSRASSAPAASTSSSMVSISG